MMNKEMVMAMVKEYEQEQKNVKLIPHYYKRNDKMVERSYPDRIYSDRYYELKGQIESAKIFRCSVCGEYHNYFDLETWCCDFEKEDYICGLCFEEAEAE